jgi:two-component sensor histidine kinase
MREPAVDNFDREPGPIYWLRDLAQLSISLVEFRARTATFPNVQQELSDLAQRLHALSQPILASTDDATGMVSIISMLRDRWAALHSRLERPDISGMVGGDELWLPVQQSIALNLAADEILRNSLRHAFPNRSGHVVMTVAYKPAKDSAMIRIADDGIGAPNATLATSTNGLGLVRELAGQLNADFGISSSPTSGTAVTFRFSTHRDRVSPV